MSVTKALFQDAISLQRATPHARPSLLVQLACDPPAVDAAQHAAPVASRAKQLSAAILSAVRSAKAAETVEQALPSRLGKKLVPHEAIWHPDL